MGHLLSFLIAAVVSLSLVTPVWADNEPRPGERAKNYAKAMERLAAKYPDDAEAKIFYALALNETFDHKSMEPLLRAIKILEPIDKKYPDHPGVTHYLIHSYDFPPIAQKGIPAANKYAQIAPSAPHAQHMPSHIYSMVGMWE